MITVDNYRKAANEQTTIRGRMLCNLRMLWRMPSQPIEVVIGVGLLTTGVLFLFPGDASYATTPGWAFMREFIPEAVAGAIMTAIGVGKIMGVILGSDRARNIFSYAALAFLSIITVSFLSASFFGVWPLFATMGLSSAWAIIRQGRPW